LARADAAAEDARQARDEAAGSWREAAGSLAALTDRAEAVRAALAAAGAPRPEEVSRLLAEADRLASLVRTADAALRAARATRDRARMASRGVQAQLSSAWAALDAARDPLVGLGAPALPRDDLAPAWALLTSWASAQAASRDERMKDAAAEVSAARSALAGEEDRVVKLLAEAGVDLPPDRPVAAVAEPAVAARHERARAAVDRVAERRALADRLTAARAEAARDQVVAHTLAALLRADAFPRWLVGAALDLLVADASATLAELSGGQFELAHAGGSFEVVDHHDADARRPVKTLSGGETFQASLALALALSAQLSTMAAAGAATPEAIILDEGFGTLDDQTLETVAGTLENLAAARGRMVGLVTHHPALAARVPVRYRVTRDHGTSRVEREDPGA
jgi:exonuclease SbcC